VVWLALLGVIVLGFAPTSEHASATHEEPFDRGIDRACPHGDPAVPFGDIAGNVHASEIACIAWWGIARGVSEAVYDPSSPVLRDQMASFIARKLEIAGVDVPWDAPAAFADVSSASVHFPAVNALAQLEVVVGHGDDTYRPKDGVRRDQMASFISRSAEHSLGVALTSGEQHFDDVGADSVHFAAVNGLAQAGIVVGRDAQARLYEPRSGVRRDAMASFLGRTVDLLIAEGVLDEPENYEIWALDQGTDIVHVYDAFLREVARIDLGAHAAPEVRTPHMIDFDSQGRYAFVANIGSGNVAVVRTADYEVVDVVDTGAVAHMAAVTPDDSAIWVANIGALTFTEIVADWEAESFTVGRELDVTQDPAWQETFRDIDPAPAPVCHEYTADSRFAYVTLGPGAGGLIVVDLEGEPEIVEAFDPDVVKANCGLALTADGQKMYANWGSPAQTAESPGEWYVFGTDDHTLIGEPRSAGGEITQGIDPHGVRITPDGGLLWQVNRGSHDALIIDTATDEVADEFEFVGDTPDIIDFSPDGRRVFASLRGPNPRSGNPHVATGQTPGFSVLKSATGEVLFTVQPADDLEDSDFHGIGVLSDQRDG
jgi:DNA-binding beta-propeller fold protein YncE